MLNNILAILCPIAVSTLFSTSEISLTASRRIRLKLLAGEGSANAWRVLEMQENPGAFFTAVRIGFSAVAILGGIMGDAAFSPAFHSLLSGYMSPEPSEQLSSVTFFILVTSLFVLFTDLIPKRIGMIIPETVVLHIINPTRFCLLVFRPLMRLFNGMANMIFHIFKLLMVCKDDITSDDIYAIAEAGTLAGVLRKQERGLIENVLKLESRTVPPSMTSRENVIWFDLHEDGQNLKDKVAEHPHSKFLVYNEGIDRVIDYVDSKDLLNHVPANQSLVPTGGMQTHDTLIMPDTLILLEVLESFKTASEDFAVIMNEYALMIGIITLNDVMTTLVGGFVGQRLEEQIATRNENSWLIDSGTSIGDVVRVLDINEFPQSGNCETIDGFMMFMLRKIPKRADAVRFPEYEPEVIGIDNYRIDQLLVTRVDNRPTVLTLKQAETAEGQNA